MLVVVDVNVLFSALHSKSLAYDVFSFNRIHRMFDWVAPEYMLSELDGNRDRLLSKSRISEEEMIEMLGFLKSEIEVIPQERFGVRIPEAVKALKGHVKDAPYVALALALDCPIFSGDKRLRQLSPVTVYDPRQMLDSLSKAFSTKHA